MLGLGRGVGLVTDDGVGVLENIFRHIEEEGRPPMRAASEATAEIALAVMATTLSLVIIFLPVAFMAGRVGRFFHSFGLTVAVAIMISLLISFTLTPALSARVLRRLPPERAHGGRLYRAFEAVYGRLLAWSLRHRWVIVLVALGTVLSTVPLIHVVGKTFLPQDDQSEFEIDIQTPGGFTLAESSRIFGEIEHHVRSLRGVTDVLTTIGDQSGRVKPGEGDVTTGSLYVRLKDLGERSFSQFDVMADARWLMHQYPDLRTAVQGYVAGQPISKFKEADEQYDIWLRAEPGKRRTPQDVYDLTVRARTDQLVRLGNLVRVREDLGPAEIDRVNRQRSITISGNLLPALPLATAVEHVQKVAATLDMPALYSLEFTGRAKTLAESNANFGIAFLLSIVFMYMVLAAQFESFLHPVTIMLALPLTIPFALVSLVLLGEALNVYSMLGLFMLFGVVKKNGILQIDYTNPLRGRGLPRDAAILEANRVRLRPILMTTVMLVFGMVPIALGRGPGSGSRGSIARVIIGGQSLSLLITLLITPGAYSLFDDLGVWLPAQLGWLRERLRRVLSRRPRASGGA